MTPTQAISERSGPTRTCVGCREQAPPEELVRFVLGPDASVAPDLAARADGRGAWVHARAACLTKAADRGFSKSWKTAVRVSPTQLVAELRSAASRRVLGLLSAANGAKKLVIGSQGVKEELAAGRVKLLVVATDARAAIASREIEQAIGGGLAVAWGTKAELGAATHRSETGVVAVLDSGFARALRRVAELSHMPDPTDRFSTSGESSTEE